MASVVQVGEKWRALIRRKGHATQCKTFTTKARALVWAREIESAIDNGETVAPTPATITVAELLDRYRELREPTRPIADTSNEHYMLKRLKAGLGHLQLASLTPDDLVGFCLMRRDEGAGPYTVNMDVGKLGTAIRFAGALLRIQVPDVTAAARPMLTHMGLIGGGGKRERRPTEDELAAILPWLQANKGQLYVDIVHFAIATAMRRGEIARAVWSDVDESKRLLMVRDRKHPRQKKGNDMLIPLLPSAWALLERLKVERREGEPRIFPIGGSTVSKYFTEACQALSIPDLHLHDMRHEGTSRLFEDGYEIHQVAMVTGHKDWKQLKTYTNLRPESLHRANIGSPDSGK